MKEGKGGAQLAPEWRRWVVENLLQGTDAPELVAVLEGAGVDAALAREAVRAEMEDPCFEGTRKALALNRKLEGLMDLYGDLYRQSEGHERVDRHASLSGDAFFDRYYFQNRPVVMRGSVVDAASLEAWRPERLTGRGGPLAEHPGLLASLRPPAAYVVADESAGRPVLSVEAEGVLTEARPARENVLLCQVHGRRRLQLVPAFELRRMTGEPAEKEAVSRLEVELGPGELALLPVGWWYAWRVLEASTSVSFSAFAAPAPNATWAREPAPPEPTPPPWRKPG